MLTADNIEDVFPNNIVKYVALAMKNVDPDIQIFPRPLVNSDPQQSIGVFAQTWGPDPESVEMIGGMTPGPQVPSIQEYTLGVQGFVKHPQREVGLAIHAAMSQRIRRVLYTDPNLQVLLAQLSVDLDDGWTEAMRRWGVRTARYHSGEIDAQMLYLSTLEFWIETETRRTT